MSQEHVRFQVLGGGDIFPCFITTLDAPCPLLLCDDLKTEHCPPPFCSLSSVGCGSKAVGRIRGKCLALLQTQAGNGPKYRTTGWQRVGKFRGRQVIQKDMGKCRHVNLINHYSEVLGNTYSCTPY